MFESIAGIILIVAGILSLIFQKSLINSNSVFIGEGPGSFGMGFAGRRITDPRKARIVIRILGIGLIIAGILTQIYYH